MYIWESDVDGTVVEIVGSGLFLINLAIFVKGCSVKVEIVAEGKAVARGQNNSMTATVLSVSERTKI